MDCSPHTSKDSFLTSHPVYKSRSTREIGGALALGIVLGLAILALSPWLVLSGVMGFVLLIGFFAHRAASRSFAGIKPAAGVASPYSCPYVIHGQGFDLPPFPSRSCPALTSSPSKDNTIPLRGP